jgi:Major tropism determinant N-terminal domain
MVTRIQLRRDTAANWTSTNPILDQGEPGYETDTGNIKYGNGSSRWSALLYGGGPSGPGSLLPTASNSVLGGVIIPAVGTSGITNSAGTIALATASSTQLGAVKIDNSTITINGSGQLVATLPTASQTTLGGVRLGSVLSAHQANAQSSVSKDVNSAVTTIVYDTINFSSLPSGASYSTSTGEFTPGITGYYQINASATITTSGAPGGYAPQIGLGIAVYDTITHSAPAVIGDVVDFNLVLGAWGDTTPLVAGVIKITSVTQRICIVAALAEQTGHTGGTYPTNATNAHNSVLSIAFLRSL